MQVLKKYFMSKQEKNNQTENNNVPRVIVGVFIFNHKEELFMMKMPKFKKLYTVPGGHLELGESLEDGARREIKEETNLDLIDLRQISVQELTDLKDYYDGSKRHHVYINYIARAVNPDKVKLNEEATEYKWQKIDSWLKEKKVKTSAREELESGRLDFEDFEAKYKRALADYQNLQKRAIDEKQEFAKFANEQLILEILPVYDNLKASVEHIEEAAKDNPWAEGVKYVIKQFDDILEGAQVKEIEALGKKFDPASMDALEGKGDKVKKVVKAGYTLRGKVIAPAKVILE